MKELEGLAFTPRSVATQRGLLKGSARALCPKAADIPKSPQPPIPYTKPPAAGTLEAPRDARRTRRQVASAGRNPEQAGA